MSDRPLEDRADFASALGRLLIDYDYVEPLILAQQLEAAANGLRFHNGLAARASPMIVAARPIGRELRLVNETVSLLMLINSGQAPPPGVILSDPILMCLDEIEAALRSYKQHMLKPKMKRPTLIPVRVV